MIFTGYASNIIILISLCIRCTLFIDANSSMMRAGLSAMEIFTWVRKKLSAIIVCIKTSNTYIDAC